MAYQARLTQRDSIAIFEVEIEMSIRLDGFFKALLGDEKFVHNRLGRR